MDQPVIFYKKKQKKTYGVFLFKVKTRFTFEKKSYLRLKIASDYFIFQISCYHL